MTPKNPGVGESTGADSGQDREDGSAGPLAVPDPAWTCAGPGTPEPGAGSERLPAPGRAPRTPAGGGRRRAAGAPLAGLQATVTRLASIPPWPAPSEPKVIAAFTIPGEPASKARPRFTKRGSKVQAYTPERTHEAEEIVGWRFRASAPGHKPDSENAYRVDATFISGSFQRRDLDNMLKLILDSLNKVAWDDDNQVVAISGTKRVETPGSARTEVTVSTVGPLERSRTQECPACGKRFACHPSTKQQRVYCSRECQASAGRTKVRCARCDIEFTKQNCYVRPLNYCSKECRNKNSLSSQASQWKCEECGGALSKPQYRKCRNCFLGYCGEPGAMLPLSAGLEPVSVPPRTPSALRVEEFIRLRVAGGTVVAAAEALGVTRRTGTRYEGLRKARALAETKRGRAA